MASRSSENDTGGATHKLRQAEVESGVGDPSIRYLIVFLGVLGLHMCDVVDGWSRQNKATGNKPRSKATQNEAK